MLPKIIMSALITHKHSSDHFHIFRTKLQIIDSYMNENVHFSRFELFYESR